MKHIIFFLFFIASCASRNPSLYFATPKQRVFTKKHQQYFVGKKLAIATQGEKSSEIGKRIAQAGGNIIDVAVAISFAISVERPQSTGLGGGGFMVFRLQEHGNRIFALDFREKAPQKAHDQMFLDAQGSEIKGKSRHGIHAAGVPGLVAGLYEVHRKYGKLPWAELLKPAIALAENGFKVYPHLANALKIYYKKLKELSGNQHAFFKTNGRPLKAGELLVQKDLAKTLRIVAEKGHDGFYSGPIAQKIAATSQKYGGLMTFGDLQTYAPVWRKPVVGEYRGYQIFSMPPPSSGGAHIIQMLNTLKHFPLKKWGPYSPKTIHVVSQAMELAFRDRAHYLGDADFVDVPIEQIVSPEYGSFLAKKINPAEKTSFPSKPLENFQNRYESSETTHFSLMDNQGNMVASTQTINGYLGSKVIVPGTGVILNNEMDDFATKPGNSNQFGAIGGDKNLVTGGKRPLSSMSPTLVMRGNRPVLVTGSPGGTKIITCTLHTILNYITHQRSIQDAVRMARYHHQWQPHHIRFDENTLPLTLQNQLRSMGHDLEEKTLNCKVQSVLREGRLLKAVSDQRGEGVATGI